MPDQNAETYPFGKLHFDRGSAPATPSAGELVVYADDADGQVKVKDSAGRVTNLGSGAELDYVAITSDAAPTATSEATANTVVTANAITFDGATDIVIEFFASGVTHPAGANLGIFLILYDGASSIGFLASVINANATNAIRVPVFARRRLTPSTGSHTYSVRAYVSSGTGGVKAGAGGSGAVVPAFIRITRA